MDETLDTIETTEVPEFDETIESSSTSLPFTSDDVVKMIALTLVGCVVKLTFDTAIEKGVPKAKKALAERKATKAAKAAKKAEPETQLIGVK